MFENGVETEDIICLDPETPKKIAEGVAEAFVSFVTILADAFTDGSVDEDDTISRIKGQNKKIIQKYKDLAKVAGEVKTAMGHIKEIMTSFADILKLISENSDIGNIEEDSGLTSSNSGINSVLGGARGLSGGMRPKEKKNKVTLEMAPMYAMILSTAIMAFLDIFSEPYFNYSTYELDYMKDKAKETSKYLDKLYDVVDSYGDVLRTLGRAYDIEPDAEKILQ